jgi:uncharacterized protein with GYD domain
MAKFLVQGCYTTDGLHGLMKDKASGRKAAVAAAVKSQKGKLEAMYFGVNGADIVMLIDAPDNVSAASLSVIAMSSGGADISVTPLLTVDELDTALAATVKYRAPGA